MGAEVSKGNIEDFYTIGKVMGKGFYATVKQAVRKSDNAKFAVKIVRKARLDAKEAQLLRDEITICRRLNHPNVVRLYEIFDSPKRVYLVMELMNGGDLVDAVITQQLLSERRTSWIIRDVASALFYCHRVGVVHRDIKPENILFLDGTPKSPAKLTDFGLAKAVSASTVMSTCCGSPNFVAPEVLLGGAYTEMVDMWSLGVTLYTLLVGYRPFDHKDRRTLFDMIQSGKYKLRKSSWSNISRPAVDLVRRLLVVDPNKRLNAQGVLMHPWVTGGVASDEAFPMVHSLNFRKQKAMQRLRLTVQAVLALNRIRRCVENFDMEKFRENSIRAKKVNSEKRSLHDIFLQPPEAADSTGPQNIPSMVVRSRNRARSAWTVLNETGAVGARQPARDDSGVNVQSKKNLRELRRQKMSAMSGQKTHDDSTKPNVLEAQELYVSRAMRGALTEIEELRKERDATTELFEQMRAGGGKLERKLSLTELRQQKLAKFRSSQSFSDRKRTMSLNKDDFKAAQAAGKAMSGNAAKGQQKQQAQSLNAAAFRAAAAKGKKM